MQTFDCSGTLSIEYTYDDETKRTTFEIEALEDDILYELRYDGFHEESEPTLIQRP